MTAISRVILVALLSSGMTGVAIAKEKAAAVAPGAADGKNLSKPARTAIVAAQAQQTAGDNAGALATIRAVRAAGGLNETDRFYLAQTQLGIGQTLKDDAVLEEALKESIDSQFLPGDQREKYLLVLAQKAQARRDYTSATQFYERLVQIAPQNPQYQLGLALIYRDLKQNQKAIDVFTKAIAASETSGQKAPEAWYQTRLQIAYDGNLQAAVAPASMGLVTAYPTPANWSNTLLIFRDANKTADQLDLDVLRLMHALGALGAERTWQEYASLALEKGLPGEAKAILDEGIAKRTLTGTRPMEKEISTTAGGKIVADKASLPGLERDAAKAPNGKAALATGDAYYGYGNYIKAAEMYQLAASKAAGVDLSTVNLRLGAARAMAGDKAGATAAFQAVNSGPRQQLAQFWLIRTNGKVA